jgi:hypothetical protein
MRVHISTAVVALGVLLSVNLAAGCGTRQRLVYDKPGLAVAEGERDENECLRKALTQDVSGRILTVVAIDRDVYARCMEARGYMVRPAR